MGDGIRVLVVGATGSQGGAVARHLLTAGRYEVRCLARNCQSSAALALLDSGAELVAGDLNDPASLQTALQGCDAVFGVTDYWEHFEREFDHGRNLIDAIAHSNIQHTILSTCPPAKALSGGALEVPAFDTKARIEDYARNRGLQATYLHVAFYYENFLNYFKPRPHGDGSYIFSCPQGSTPLAAVSVEDLGGVVAGILMESFWYRDQQVGVVGDDLRCEDYASIMSRALQRKIEYQYLPPASFAAMRNCGKEPADHFEFKSAHVPNRTQDLVKSREIFPEIRTFERWLRANMGQMRRVLNVANC